MIKQREANSWKSVSYAKSITGAQTYTKFPIVLRTTEQSIPTWNVKGNTETSGTPSPSNPITISGVGERTANLFTGQYSQFDNTGGTGTTYAYFKIDEDFTLSFKARNNLTVPQDYYVGITANGGNNAGGYTWALGSNNSMTQGEVRTVRSSSSDYHCFSFYPKNETVFNWLVENFDIMLNTGSTALPYEPFGYKIPLSSNGTALIPIYLSNQLMKIDTYSDSVVSSGTVTHNIKKVVFNGTESWTKVSGSHGFFTDMIDLAVDLGARYVMCTHYAASTSAEDGTLRIANNKHELLIYDDYASAADFQTFLQQQYAAGTPVTVYYILATPTTETVTAPSITTTSGLNTIDVNTTVKPSEMSLTYNGWRINKQKKKSANLFDYTSAAYGITDAFLQSNGNVYTDITSSKDWVITDYIPCNGTAFTLNPIFGVMVAICLYDENKNYITGTAYYCTQIGSVTITSNTTAKYIRFSWLDMPESENYVDPATIMLNADSTALPYAPYWE